MRIASLWRGSFLCGGAAALALAAIVVPAHPEPSVNAAARQEMIDVAAAGASLRVRVFVPKGSAPFPLAIVNHGSPASPAQRPSMPVPTFASASDWLLAQGYLVALPLRRGYGETGGEWAEGYGSCSNPDYHRAGLTTADDIDAVLTSLRARKDVRRDHNLIVGYSAVGWGSIAAASRNPAGVLAVLNFAGGRGGGQPNVGNCAPNRLVDASARFGATARIASLWVYAANDKFFAPDLSRRMFDAYAGAGGAGEYVALPAFGNDGHAVFASVAGRVLWQPPADAFLGRLKR
jgi:dienelactone hydrolase